MVRSGQNMTDAVRHEPGENRQYPGRCRRVIVEPGAAAVENGLRGELVVLVKIHERLMHGVVGKHLRRDADDSR
jgi:hypothetical protein